MVTVLAIAITTQRGRLPRQTAQLLCDPMELPDGDLRAEMRFETQMSLTPHQDLLARTINRAGKRASIVPLRRGLHREPANGHRHELGRTTRAPCQGLYRHLRTAGWSGTKLLWARTELRDN